MRNGKSSMTQEETLREGSIAETRTLEPRYFLRPQIYNVHLTIILQSLDFCMLPLPSPTSCFLPTNSFCLLKVSAF